MKRSILKFEIDTNHLDRTSSEKPSSISCECLANGGTKSIYRCSFQDQTFGLAIPSSLESFWLFVFNEIELTNKLRQLNYPVLPYHHILPVRINEVTIPSIVMPLFSSLDGTIIDHKFISSYMNDLFCKIESSGKLIRFSEIDSTDVFIDVAQPLLRQLARLAHEQYFIPQDAINFRVSGTSCLELFLFDLQGMKKIEDYTTKFIISDYSIILMILLYVCLEENASYKRKTKYNKCKIDFCYKTNTELMQRINKELEDFVLSESFARLKQVAD